jgi:POT family proton-dependent oligopeptide transporter
MSIAFWIMISAWVFVLIWVPFIIHTNRKLHPKALFVLFFAEMWERFSYYGMRALLTLYMVKELFDYLDQGQADKEALGIYGSYTAMVYLFPVIGGIIADKILGFRKAILFGGILMMAGHFALALEGMFFGGNMQLFFMSLTLIIIGNGFFKPNISSFLGKFYGLNDSRKDGAFTIFYMGVNIGALLSIVTCSYVADEIGWHYGFGLAGLGMLLGLLVFWFFGPISFGNKGRNPSSHDITEEIDEEKEIARLRMSQDDRKQLDAQAREEENFQVYTSPKLKRNQILTIIGTIVFVPICAQFLNLSDIVTGILLTLSIGILLVLLFMSFKQDTLPGKQRIWVIMVLFVFHAVFWALFEQAGGSITLFTERNVLRAGIPAPTFQFFNSLFIILLAPLFSWLWIKMRNSGKEPSTPMKFVLGLFFLALGFAIIVLGAEYFAIEGMVSMGFLIAMYFFHTTGELCLSPVGLSMITKLSPAKAVGFVMGAWFLSISLANKMAGLIGELTAKNDTGETALPTETLAVYSNTYLVWGVLVVLGSALILLLMVPKLRTWMHGIH